MKLNEFDFRIWDKDHKGCSNKDCKCQSKFTYGEEAKVRLSEFKIDVGIELWTRLKDRNGKKIYENDIVKYFKGIVLIHYIFTEAKFALCTKQGNQYFLIEELLYSNRDEYEVIGNIHENAELLNENNH